MFRPLAEELEVMVPGEFRFCFISLDAYYNQNVEGARQHLAPEWKYVLLARPERLTRHFYRRSPVEMWRDCLQYAEPSIAHLFAEAPDLVVVGNDRGLIEKLFLHQANQHGVPTLLVQDGVLSALEGSAPTQRLKHLAALPFRLLGFSRLMPTRYGSGGARYVACYGELSRELFLSRGVRPEAVTLIGQMRYDTLLNPPTVLRGGEEPQISYFATSALWCLADPEGHHAQLLEIRELYSALDALYPDGFKLMVKLHPRERREHYVEALSELDSARLEIVDDRGPFEVIAASDLVVTTMSTTWIEAFLIGKPCVISDIHFAGTSIESAVIAAPGLLVGKTRDALQDVIAQVLGSDDACKRYVDSVSRLIQRELLFLPGEKAASRLANLVRTLLGDTAALPALRAR
jgi:hypothetical protein